MRRVFVLLLALAFLPLPAMAQSGPDIAFNLSATANVSVDLIEDDGSTIAFSISQSSFSGSPEAVVLVMGCECPADEISVNMVRSGNTWNGDLDVADQRLFVGVWTVVPQGASGTGSEQAESRTLTVTAQDDDGAPRFEIRNLNETTNTLRLGSNQAMRVDINETLLHKATYQIGQMPKPVTLPSPYILQGSSFAQGDQTVNIAVHDRVGNVAELAFTVFRDSLDPEVSIGVPSTVYLGVPNTFSIEFKDISDSDILLRLGNQSAAMTATGSSQTQQLNLTLTPSELGSTILELIAQDALDNQIRLVSLLNVSEVITDIVLIDAHQTGPNPVIGEPIQIEVEAQQATAVTQVPFDIWLNVTGEITLLGTMNVSKDAPATATFNVTLPAGVHAVNIFMSAPQDVTELNDTNQDLNLTIETFMGRVIFGDDQYHIRAKANGLPDVAIGPNGTDYALKLGPNALLENQNRDVYNFDVGTFGLYWDPATLVTTIDPASFVNVDPDPEGDEDIPAPALILLLVALAGLALRRRD